jgi:RNA polymerase sigma-70 factor (ECF subfamily)
LLRAVQGDQQSAWSSLVELYSPSVYTWLRRKGLLPEDAADVCQEVMRSVARSVSEFEPDGKPASFRRWLRRITQRRLADFYRGQKRQVARAAGGSAAWMQIQDEPADSAWGAEARSTATLVPEPYRRAVDQVRSEFSEKNWLIFWRIVVEDGETAEVAEEFGVSANVVRLAKSRISRRLKEVFEEQSEAR